MSPKEPGSSCILGELVTESSAYTPRSNLWDEATVKSMKRVLQGNIAPNGELNTETFCRALLNYRNTPDRETGRSPAQVVFGRVLHNTVPIRKYGYKPCREWLLVQEERERALARRHVASREPWDRAIRPLTPLVVGTIVSVQSQRGDNKDKWDNLGVIMECLPLDWYKVRIDGSGRITLGNCVTLRQIIPFNLILDHGPQMEHPKASLKPKSRKVEVGSFPDIPLAPQVPAFNIPDASQGTIIGVPVVPCVSQEITLDENLNRSPGDSYILAIVTGSSSRIKKIPNRLDFA